MPGIETDQFLDVVVSVRKAYPMMGSFDYLFDDDCPRKFELLQRLTRGDRVMVRGGQYVANHVVYRETGAAAFVLPAQTYEPGIENVLVEANVPWAHANTNWSIVDEEIRACREPEQLVGIIKPRRGAAKMDLAMLIEAHLWAAADATSKVLPLTVPYYVKPIHGDQVKDDGTYDSNCGVAGGFQGGVPTGYSDVAGIDPGAYVQGTGWDDNTYRRWRNYNWQWSNSSGLYTDTDEDRMGFAFDYMGFESPPMVNEIDTPAFQDTRMYTNRVTKQSMERRAKQQNDQVGFDLAHYQNHTLFRGLPLIWQNRLDTYDAARGYYPTYMLRWNFGGMAVRQGHVFVERTFGGDKYLPDVTTTHLDITYQMWCHNRQLFGAVGSYVAST